MAGKESSSKKAIESIEIQKNYYEKQLNLLNLKKTFHDKSAERIQKDVTAKIDINEQIDSATNLQIDILKTIEELAKNNSNSTELTQLNFFISKLFILLDVTVRENVSLKERKQDDEVKLSPCTDNQAKKVQEVINTELLLSGDSEEDEEISDLPPLECPDFDV